MADNERSTGAALPVPAPGHNGLPPGAGEERLQAMFEIAKTLATGNELEAMLPSFLSCLISTLHEAEVGLLLLFDPSEGKLVIKAAHGYSLPTLSDFRLAPGESMSGKAFESGRAALYPTPEAAATAMADLTQVNRDIFLAATLNSNHPLSAICVPLALGDKRLGALVLENLHRPNSFGEDDLAFLQHVADLIALAIENSRLREELQAVRSMEEANRLKAELISTLAHEMRTPLTSIKGYSTAMLMDEVTFSPETQREFLEIIDDECNILQDLIHDLLESSVIDAGLLKLEPQPILMARLAQEVVDDVARRSHKHHFVVDFAAGFPIVEADPLRITQVLRNLLDNALKYSQHGGLIVVRGQAQAEEAIISVSDQGVGIAPEHLNRLFEKFFRIKSGLGRHIVGAGLGLPIARTIVESHGGRIWAESTVGQGSTFYFTLPLKTGRS